MTEHERIFTTDDLPLAATLAAMGARVKEVSYSPEKRRSDIVLVLSSFKIETATAMMRSFADTLDDLGDDFTIDELEIAFKGTFIHHCFNWMNDLRRMVVARRKMG
jgi:hypothetical protein